MRECELCGLPARMYCESDQASLCWECDAKVHGANFLVARHTRSLLCRSCQAPTPWRASGARLGPTASVCERCMGSACEVEEERGGGIGSGRVGGGGVGMEGVVGGDGDGPEEEDDDEEEEEEEEEEEDDDDDYEEEDGDNQVVPWSMGAGTTVTPPPVASSSSSDESSSGRMAIRNVFQKRMRENVDLSSSQDDIGGSPSRPSYLLASATASPSVAAAAGSRPSLMTADDEGEEEATSFRGGSFRPSKDRKKTALTQSNPAQQAARQLSRPARPSWGDCSTVDLVTPGSRCPPI